MLNNQAVLNPENIAGSESERATGGRNSRERAVMGAAIDEACGRNIAGRDRGLDLYLEVRYSSQPCSKDCYCPLLRRLARWRRRRGRADLMVDVILREQRCECREVVRTQGRRELLDPRCGGGLVVRQGRRDKGRHCKSRSRQRNRLQKI